MTILAQVYSGHRADDPLIPCLEISSPAFAAPIRNCAGFEDQTVTLEGGGITMGEWPGIVSTIVSNRDALSTRQPIK